MQTAQRAKSEPVLLIMSVLAGLQLLFAGVGLGDIIGVKVVFLGMLAVGAIQGGVQFWVRGQVVELANVVALVNPANTIVAGPALLTVDDGIAVEVAPV